MSGLRLVSLGLLSVCISFSAGATEKAKEFRILFVGIGLHNSALPSEKQAVARLQARIKEKHPHVVVLSDPRFEHPPGTLSANGLEMLAQHNPDVVVYWRSGNNLALEVVDSLKHEVDWSTEKIIPSPMELELDGKTKLIAKLTQTAEERWKVLLPYKELLTKVRNLRGRPLMLEEMFKKLNEQTVILEQKMRHRFKFKFHIYLAPHPFHSSQGFFDDKWIANQVVKFWLPYIMFPSKAIRGVLGGDPSYIHGAAGLKDLYSDKFLDKGSAVVLNEKGMDLWAEQTESVVDRILRGSNSN